MSVPSFLRSFGWGLGKGRTSAAVRLNAEQRGADCAGVLRECARWAGEAHATACRVDCGKAQKRKKKRERERERKEKGAYRMRVQLQAQRSFFTSLPPPVKSSGKRREQQCTKHTHTDRCSSPMEGRSPWRRLCWGPPRWCPGGTRSSRCRRSGWLLENAERKENKRERITKKKGVNEASAGTDVGRAEPPDPFLQRSFQFC